MDTLWLLNNNIKQNIIKEMHCKRSPLTSNYKTYLYLYILIRSNKKT